MKKTNNIISKIFDSITPERQAELDKMMEAHIKWHEEHPDHKDRYGTDRSYWLQSIREAGFNPVGITVMLCEETLIMETREELELACKKFSPEGWWYTLDDWQKARSEYVEEFYSGKYSEAPRVYCLNDKYKINEDTGHFE